MICSIQLTFLVFKGMQCMVHEFLYCDVSPDETILEASFISEYLKTKQIPARFEHLSFTSYPGTEGKAGMAAVANLEVDLVKLNRNLQEMLPSYARPIFIKLVQSLTVTGKHVHNLSLSICSQSWDILRQLAHLESLNIVDLLNLFWQAFFYIGNEVLGSHSL